MTSRTGPGFSVDSMSQSERSAKPGTGRRKFEPSWSKPVVLEMRGVLEGRRSREASGTAERMVRSCVTSIPRTTGKHD